MAINNIPPKTVGKAPTPLLDLDPPNPRLTGAGIKNLPDSDIILALGDSADYPKSSNQLL
jgi:hypothetical protein